ncbi:Pisatin demethylase [Colletotrichum spinosum]|uniref:Pisatin demethylase n=1 Tax=Colletotrichum spinosum TaxID=1347390 RepID=A0A4R8PZC7_9PEZI|nr:Pisatin demethylase [Colletotrichum spinosum]
MKTEAILPLAAISAVGYLFYTFIQWLRSPLRSVPGPYWARFTNAWYLFTLRKGDFEATNLSLHKKYGPIVRYGPNRYSFDNPEASKTIYGHGTQFVKSDWYSTFEPNPSQPNLFSDRVIQHHAHNRRFYTNAYAMSSLIHYEPYLDECGEIFSQRLHEFAQAGASFNMSHWFQCFAFDAIAYATYDKRLGFLDAGDDIGETIKAIEFILDYSSQTGIYPFIHRYIIPILAKITPSNGKKGTSYMLEWTQQRIDDERNSPKSIINFESEREGSTKGETFLAKFFAKHAEMPDAFTNFHILNGCSTNMVAGSDTTGISLSATLYHLLRNPDCFTRLRAEIDEFDRRGELSPNPTFSEGQKMPYFQAVIKEALRLHPAVGLPLERVVPKGGATISGRFFPEGTIVGVNAWVQHKNKVIFGEDAEEFRPERWLTEDEGRLSAMNRNWMPFGLGSRTCIGKNVSILEMTKLIPRIVRDFDFQLEGNAALPQKSWKTYNMWFVKPQDFYVTVKPRQSKA